MFGIGWMELMFILVIALVFLGPDKMLETARFLGKAIREVRRTTDEITRSLSLDDELSRPSQEPTTHQESLPEPEGSQPRDGGTGTQP